MYNIISIKRYINTSFYVKNNKNIHTGKTTTTGKFAVHMDSTKQNFSTRRSTEYELVRVYYDTSQTIKTRYFIKSQGYQLNGNFLYLDKKSYEI